MATTAQTDVALPAEHDLEAYSGDNLQFEVDLYTDEAKTIEYDLSIFTTMRMQIKTERAGTTALVEATLGDGLTILPVNTIAVDIPGDRMQLERRSYFYDIEGQNATETLTVLTGRLKIDADVTR